MAEQNREATDIQVAGSLVVAGLLSDEGLQALQGVLQGASNPAAAVANAVYMALSKVREKLDSQGMPIEDKLWMANGGVLDRVLFEICGALKAIFGFQEAASPQFVNSLKQEVVALMQQEETGGSPAAAQPTPQGMPPAGPTQAPTPLSGGLMGGV